jgi:hypothetical protein
MARHIVTILALTLAASTAAAETVELDSFTGPDVENRIVAYLAENYPPEAGRRRAAIPPDLMPPNPYSPPTGTDRE